MRFVFDDYDGTLRPYLMTLIILVKLRHLFWFLQVDFGTEDAKHCFCKESDLLAIVQWKVASKLCIQWYHLPKSFWFSCNFSDSSICSVVWVSWKSSKWRL